MNGGRPAHQNAPFDSPPGHGPWHCDCDCTMNDEAMMQIVTIVFKCIYFVESKIKFCAELMELFD